MRRFLSFLVSVLVLGGAVAAAKTMMDSAETAAPSPKPVPPPEVSVATLQAQARPAILSGTGVVEAARQLTVVPEVGGRIVYQSPALTVGGRVKRGDVLVRLDRSAYELALRQQRSQVEQAKLEKELEGGRGELAAREWELLQGKQDVGGPGRLASRQAHAEAADVAVDAARSSLERARLDLSRTVIRAPFDATVTRESVEVGQVVGPSSSLATLVGTDEVWARVALPVDSLRLVRVPQSKGDGGSLATVTQRMVGGSTATWNGTVTRLVHELDTESRMLQLLVAVEKPFDVQPGGLPLLPGAFVTVEIHADAAAPTIAVPRKSLFEGRRVWTLDGANTLRGRELTVLWGDADRVYAEVTPEVADGARIVLEPPVGAIEGMKVVPRVEDAPAAALPQTAEAGASGDSAPVAEEAVEG